MKNTPCAFLLLAVAAPASAVVAPLPRAAGSAQLTPAAARATPLATAALAHAAAAPLAASPLAAGPAGAVANVLAPAASDAKGPDAVQQGLDAVFDGVPQDLAAAVALARLTAGGAGHSRFLDLGAEATLDGSVVTGWNVSLEAKPADKGWLTRWRKLQVAISKDAISVAETGKRALSRSARPLPELNVDFKTFVANTAKFYPDLRFEKATAVRGFSPSYGYSHDPYDTFAGEPITRYVLEARSERAPGVVYRFYPESDALEGKNYFFTNAFEGGADLESLPADATVWGGLTIYAGSGARAARLRAVVQRFTVDWVSPENQPIDDVGHYRLKLPAGQLRRLIEVANSMGVRAGYHYAETE